VGIFEEYVCLDVPLIDADVDDANEAIEERFLANGSGDFVKIVVCLHVV
jgi:hypothetical protein